ncbi:MAG TPA: aminoacyl-tRNA hydrolase [Candidatus Saccharimonas sp.]|nr:aminoacyl-tRNA hydrolase [Candidatus Saccharimonas sp.]
MKLIVGLGNLGPAYTHTRHNAGFMVVNRLAVDLHASAWKAEAKFKAEVAEGEMAESKVIFMKPLTMMNLSGEAVQRAMQFYKLQPADVWVVFDDVDTPFGRMRLREGGSGSGHQGVNSVIRHIGTGFIRAKIGISLNDRSVEPSEVYVLKPFTSDEQAQLPQLISAAATTLAEQLALPLPTGTTFDLL